MYVFAPERQGKISGREVFEAGTRFGEGLCGLFFLKLRWNRHETIVMVKVIRVCCTKVVRAFVPVEIIMSWLVAKIRFKVFLFVKEECHV